MTGGLIDEINKLVGLQLGKRNVHETDRLLEDLGAESADVANLVAAVESKYGIIVSESEIARISTPLDIYELVLRKTQ
jgi:acyl carrier protein